ncbi:MAG: hypothetical protein HN507_09075 [Flavobacteriaceae bacterium]|jgi:hypothetical protein|nr:hypothetical protein [Flavobacteriaceae bacterium]
MKMKHTLLFFISLLFLGTYLGKAQGKKEITAKDSIVKSNKYGLRLGLDLARPVKSLVDEYFYGYEIMADFRITDRFYIAAEFGNDKDDQIEENLVSSTKGTYVKLGADFNAYNNWVGMNNSIYAGLRYGFSTFDQDLKGYTIYTGDSTFPGTIVDDPISYSGLTAHWVEFIFGIKTEVFNNLFLSINLQLKNKFYEEVPENFNNLYIPGFNTTNDYSDFGVGFGYGVSYLIPIYKK